MQNHLDNLKVFGFGLALFIPLVVMLKHMHHKIGFFLFVLLIIGTLFILSKVNKMILPYLLLLIGLWASLLFGEHRPLGNVAIGFLAISLGILAVSFSKPYLLDGIYRYWMKGAHFIGMIITATVLIIFYFLVFGIAGIVLKLMRKDLLDQKFNKSAQTYWLKIEKTLDKDSYKRQF